jgi:hypothetical protein
VDVVAARAGYGGVVTQGNAGLSELEKAWCQVVRCGQTGHALDLDAPPAGYEVAQPAASLATLSGGIAMTEGRPPLGQRGLLPAGSTAAAPPVLPHLTRFALASSLRAGAIVRKGSFGHARDVIPINSYAQYVLKLTLAMAPRTTMVTSDEAVMPDADELDVHVPAPRATGFLAWIQRHIAGVGLTIVLLAIVVLVVAIPGLRLALSAVFKRLAPKE